jgi:ADP-ribose pyrophosphatase
MDQHPDLRETLLRSEQIYKGKIVTLLRDTVRLPDGREAVREVIRHAGAVGMVPLTEDGQVLLVRQWRHATEQAMLEIPAGALAPGEDPAACAGRELAEEIGFAARRLDTLTTLFTSPGYVRESIVIYLARDLHPETAEGDEDENMQVVPMTLAESLAACLDGRITDGKTIAALFLAREFLAREQTNA